MNKKLVKIGLLSSVIISLYCCSGTVNEQTVKTAETSEEFQQTVKTAIATKTTQEKSLMLTGKVDYDLDKVANYNSLANGVIVKSSFSMGGKVQQGQVMLEIKSTELNNLQSELISARAEQKVANRAYESAKDLFDDNMLSQKELYEAEAIMRQAESLVKKLEQDQSIYGGDIQKGLYIVKAPITGYVVEKNINGAGSIISEGEQLFTIADLSTVWVMANVYAGNLANVKEGQQVEITTYAYPNDVFNGFIDSMSPTFDNEEKVIKAKIKMNNEGLKLKPEMSVSINLKELIPLQLIAVPSSALIFDNNKYYVIVNNMDNSYAMKQVKVENHNNDIAYIYGDVNDGDKVVIKNQLLIYSKLKEQQKDA